MDSFREMLSANGLSEEFAILIANARSPGTVSHYELTWYKWDSWCDRRKSDPIRCPIRDVVQFLMKCSQEGFTYKSAISAYQNPIEGISMGKYPRVSDLLTGIFNKNSPQPKFSFMWDVKRVTKFLSSQRFERNGNLKDMTLKLTMLFALISANRASDILYLDKR